LANATTKSIDKNNFLAQFYDHTTFSKDILRDCPFGAIWSLD